MVLRSRIRSFWCTALLPLWIRRLVYNIRVGPEYLTIEFY